MKKIIWFFKRHPALYYVRFKLLSHNSDQNQTHKETYNAINHKKDIPSYFYEINDRIFENFNVDSDIEKAKHIASWLRKHIKGGPGLSVSSEEALKIMLKGKGGVCSDMVQVFNNFCVINDILVKEWGITTIPFNREFGGHAVNEIYSKELEKWVLLDISRCIMFIREDNNEPLSAIELFSEAKRNFKYDAFLFDKLDDSQINNYYYNPIAEPFLICNYRNKIYDKYLNTLRPHAPVFFIHFLIFIMRKSYHYKFPLNDYKNMFVNQ